MANIDLEVAQVLDDAADLYESEQIEWCKGSWYTDFKPGPGIITATGTTISMCAEGALMKAAGLRDTTIAGYNATQRESLLGQDGAEARNKFNAARSVVSAALTEPIPTWNDRSSTCDKQAVIDVFREIAKDIRNNAPAEEL